MGERLDGKPEATFSAEEERRSPAAYLLVNFTHFKEGGRG